MSVSLIAKAGEIVTCEAGHEIYRILQDILGSTICQSYMFVGIGDIPDPEPFMTMGQCPKCKSIYARMRQSTNINDPWGGVQLHVGTEWRPKCLPQ